MANRTLYDGQLWVSHTDYLHAVDTGDGDVAEAQVDDLDERITTRDALAFTLDYPFDRPFHGEVRADASDLNGLTLRHVIDAIRAAYGIIYAGSTATPMEKLDNMHVRGPYGEAMHTIDDLVIESIELDDDTGRLEVFIGS